MYEARNCGYGGGSSCGRLLRAAHDRRLVLRAAIEPKKRRRPCYVFAEESPDYTGHAEATWRVLVSRGRRFGLVLALSNPAAGQSSATSSGTGSSAWSTCRAFNQGRRMPSC